MEHALVISHFPWLRQDEDSSFIPFQHSGRLSQGSCFALKPLVSRLRYASKVPLETWLLKAFPTFEQCVCPPALRKLRTYDVGFSNDA